MSFKAWKRCLICCMSILSGVAAINVYGASPADKEAQVKTAFIYNFTKFIDWPASEPGSEITVFSVCVLKPNPFGAALESFEHHQVRGRPVKTRLIDEEAEIPGCQVLFIRDAGLQALPGVLKKCQQSKTLTISDSPGFAKIGGMIQFVTRENKIRFEINAEAAQEAGLKVSSQLLKLAQRIHGGKP